MKICPALKWIVNDNEKTSVTGFPEVLFCHNIQIKEELLIAGSGKRGRAGLKSKESQMHLG